LLPSTDDEKATAQEIGLIADDVGIGIRLLGDDWPPGTNDGARQMFASRVLTDGTGKNGGHRTLSVGAFRIKKDA
jgi:hypothetical protein